MKTFFSYIGKNWMTTAMGVSTLAMVGFSAYSNPATLASAQTISAISSGIALIAARDPKSTPLPPVK
jgi:hypothetical protein